jgi:hypothetical protein
LREIFNGPFGPLNGKFYGGITGRSKLMTASSLLDNLFSALMFAVAAFSVSRLTIGFFGVSSRVRFRALTAPSHSLGYEIIELEGDFMQLVMAGAMVGMLIPRFDIAPAFAWVIAFGLLGTWFICRAAAEVRLSGISSALRGHYVSHAVQCVAMAYALVPAMPSNFIGMICTKGGAVVIGTGRFGAVWTPSLVNGTLATVIFCSCVGDFLSHTKAAVQSEAAGSDVGALICRLVMGVTMAAMLFEMA